MELSIVIPTYNRSNLLRRTLQGLCEQAGADRIREVLVVSDGSTDATADAVDEFSGRLPVRFIFQPKSGVSTARNRGLRETRGRIVLLLDDDVIPSSKLVLEHTDFHRQSPGLESVLLGYVTWLPELRITPFMRWYGEYGALFGYALLEDGSQVDRRYLYTCNISFKTDFLRANGGFNETLTVHEDHELGFRLAKQGMKMFFRRSALGYHNQSFTFQQACDRVQRYSKGFGAFLSTEAGREMTRSEATWKSQLKRVAKYCLVRPVNSLQHLIDSNYPLPHAFYRVVYWYFATLPTSQLKSSAGSVLERTSDKPASNGESR
jgi:glycosyltransferase involved in cell wall biosynthesis